jgi:hypothetical protein
MTRKLAEIEPDIARARGAWQAAEEVHRSAVSLADDLRRRAIDGDASVTAPELAGAESAARFSELGISSKMKAVQALEAEAEVARADDLADDITATVPPLRDGVLAALDNVGAALAELERATLVDYDAVQAAVFAADWAASSGVTPRIGRNVHGVLVDGHLLGVVKVHEAVGKLTDQWHKRLFARKVQR